MSIKKYKTSKNRGKQTVILAIWLEKNLKSAQIDENCK